MFERLEDLVRRLEELNIELTDPDTINNQEKYRQLMKEQKQKVKPEQNMQKRWSVSLQEKFIRKKH